MKESPIEQALLRAAQSTRNCQFRRDGIGRAHFMVLELQSQINFRLKIAVKSDSLRGSRRGVMKP